jgi:hypothetical protein
MVGSSSITLLSIWLSAILLVGAAELHSTFRSLDRSLRERQADPLPRTARHNDSDCLLCAILTVLRSVMTYVVIPLLCVAAFLIVCNAMISLCIVAARADERHDNSLCVWSHFLNWQTWLTNVLSFSHLHSILGLIGAKHLSRHLYRLNAAAAVSCRAVQVFTDAHGDDDSEVPPQENVELEVAMDTRERLFRIMRECIEGGRQHLQEAVDMLGRYESDGTDCAALVNTAHATKAIRSRWTNALLSSPFHQPARDPSTLGLPLL